MLNRIPAQPATKDFFRFLSENLPIRIQIRAAPGKPLLYSGAFFKTAFKEIQERKRRDPQVADKEILADVLARNPVPG